MSGSALVAEKQILVCQVLLQGFRMVIGARNERKQTCFNDYSFIATTSFIVSSVCMVFKGGKTVLGEPKLKLHDPAVGVHHIVK